VRDVARADDENALARERRKRASHREMVRGVAARLHGELHDRDVVLRVHVHHRHPCAVVEPAAAVDARREARAFEKLDDARREHRRAGRGITNAIERFREAAEVVDRLGTRVAGDHRHAGFPVRRGHQHALRARQRLRDRVPRRARLARLDGAHRRAVRQEERREGGVVAHLDIMRAA
jgi:hypothetical protein